MLFWGSVITISSIGQTLLYNLVELIIILLSYRLILNTFSLLVNIDLSIKYSLSISFSFLIVVLLSITSIQ